MRATIANITDEDVIHCFQNSLSSKNIYRNFGRNHPNTIMELRDMMRRWADQKDEKNERFLKRSNDKRNNGNRSDKSQRNYSEPSRKRKPDHEVLGSLQYSTTKNSVTCQTRGHQTVHIA
jgi:nucleoside-diphosphate-sugar epimerase